MLEAESLKYVLQPWLRGFGQLIFLPYAFAGAMVLSAIAANSPAMFMGAIIGGTVSTIVGWWLGSLEDYADGLFGLNGTLIGIGSIMVIDAGIAVWAWILFMSALSSWVVAWARDHKLTVMTAPFVIITILATVLLPTNIPLVSGLQVVMTDQPSMTGFFTGISQMTFQGNLISAGLILIAFLWHDRFLLIIALGASAVSTIGAMLLVSDSASVMNGVLGFNTILTALAVFSLFEERPALIGCIACIFLSLVLTLLCYWLNLMVFTLPFVLSVWALMCAEKYKLLSYRDRTIEQNQS